MMRTIWVVLVALLSELRRRPGPAIANILAMTCGVAVFVAVALAGQAASTSFVSAVEAVSGKATHEVVAVGGVDERRFAEIAVLPGVSAAQPIVEGRVLARDLPPPLILGIDPFQAAPFLAATSSTPVIPPAGAARFLTEPGTAIASRRWLEDIGAQPGGQLEIVAASRAHTLTILDTYDLETLEEGARDTLLVDIATAQEILSREGRLDRIELILEADAVGSVKAALAPGESLQRPARRGEQLARMIEAFRLNLLALGGLALIVGTLLVYNAAQFSVVRRHRTLGQLRCLGTQRRHLLCAVLFETSIFGLIGGGLGLLLGRLLARGLVDRVAQTITDLYSFVRVEVTGLSTSAELGIIVGAGLIAAAAGWIPARDAASTVPRMVGVRSTSESTYRLRLPRHLVIGLFFLAVAIVAVLWPSTRWWPGLIACFALIGVGASWTPPLMAMLLPALHQMTERAGLLLAPLASGAVYRSLSRTGGAAASLGVALAMTVGVVIMIGSFDGELKRWVAQAIRADIFVGDASQVDSGSGARIPEEALAELRQTVGLRGLDTLRQVEIPLGERSAPLVGVEWTVPESRRFELIKGDASTAFDRAMSGGAVLISEPLARHHLLDVGDRFPVAGRQGKATLEIVGVFRDYSFDRGLAVTGAATFLELFGETGVRNAALYLEGDHKIAAVVDDVRRRVAGRFELSVRSNREIRQQVEQIFRRTFSVTYLLQTVSVTMALVGVSITLFGLLLERGREIATLRAIGMNLKGIRRLFAFESLLLVTFPIAVSLPLGAALAWVLTAVINLRSFGWSISYAVPWRTLAATWALAWLAGLAATALPYLAARRQSLAGALREE